MSSLLRLLKPIAVGLAIFVGGLTAPLIAPAVAQAQEEAAAPASAVLDRHLQAFAARDVDAIMEDYTEKSVFITPQGVLQGKAEIRALFEALVREFSSPEATVTVHQRHAHGPVAYIVWSAETPANSYEIATDTLYVVDGRIRYQTFASKTSAK